MPFTKADIESSLSGDDQQHDSGSSSDFDSLPEISVLDVYDLASDIGKEFEKLISLHGNVAVQGLMPKVIGVLELLEKTCSRQEAERQMNEELRRDVALLEQEKREKAVDRLRYEREIEQLEENWKKESHELLATINRLQEENRKLNASLKETAKELQQTSNISKSPVNREPDWDLFEKLRDVNEKQREQLRSRDKEYQDKLAEVESLSSEVERLSESNKELRRKAMHAADQMRCLAEERADLQATLNDQTRNLDLLNKRLGMAQRDNRDLIQSQSPDMTNKLVVDLNDPNRPRFTVAELKEILCERNELKARVSDLTDELALYKPQVKQQQHSNLAKTVALPPPAPHEATVSCPPSVEHPETVQEDSEEASGDLPVQGPMPYEPDDAPWKRSSGNASGRKRDSNIRRLFKKLVMVPSGLLMSNP